MSLAEAAARRPAGALVALAEHARRARVIFAAPALVPLLEKRSSSSPAFSPAGGARPTPSQAEATVRRTGALMALGATSVLMLAQAEELRHGALAAYAVALLGCAAVLLSPAVAERARLAAREIQGVLRWAGFACIFFCCVIVADVRAAENSLLFLFLPFLVGVWTVSLSMLAAGDAPTLPLWAPEGHDGGVVVVNVTAPPAAHGVAA
jgi:hypothetical protein